MKFLKSSSAAQDIITGDKVFIKKIERFFEGTNIQDQIKLLQKIKVMKHCIGYENLLELKDIFTGSTNFETFCDIYIVTEYMESDLRDIIDSGQQLTIQHVQYFLYQILRGLKYLHSANIYYGPFYPQQVLINSDCSIKCADYGIMPYKYEAEYVTSRCYNFKSPELFLGWEGNLPAAADIWTAGLIFAELLDPDFENIIMRATCSMHRLYNIIQLLGTPKDEEIKGCTEAKQYIKSFPLKTRKNFRTLFPNASSDALNLLEKMLVFDPTKRITVDEALQHPFLKELHNPQEEPKSTKPFYTENENLGTTEIKLLIYGEIQDWNRERMLNSLEKSIA